MPPKGNSGIWHDAPFLEDLALVMYEVAYHAGGLTPGVKSAVEETLRKLGHEVSWEAIRKSKPERMSRQTMRWGPEVHEDILIALFQHVNLASGDWTVLMDALRDKGYTFTENALRLHSDNSSPISQHVQKLRKGRDLGGIAAGGGSGTPAGTPSKAGRKKSTPVKRGHKELTPVEDDEEIKNLKTEVSGTEVKMETPKKKRVKKEPAPEPISDDSGHEF